MSRGLSQPEREQILESLERIERSRGFRRSLRMTRFLRYIVEGALEGRIDDLREIVLGIEVFDRGDSFDPAVDNIVRVDAARLRSKLADYYANEGADEPIRIELPKGGYVPEFRMETPPEEAAAPPPQLHSRRSLAVLPFAARGSSQNDGLGDILTDAVVAGLGRTRGLRVTSPGSVERFRSGFDPEVIAKELGVGALLEGSIRAAGERIYATVHLTDPRDGFQLWSAGLRAEAEDAEWPNKLADQIAERLKELLIESKCAGAVDSIAAQQLCERAFRHLRRSTKDEIAKALSFFEAAIAEDPEYAWPYEGLAACRVALVELGFGPADKLLQKARGEAQRALELEQMSVGALVTLSAVDLLSWRLPEAKEGVLRAMRANPDSSRVRTLLGRILALEGDPQEALEEHERAVGLDPNDERARLALGWELCLQGACEEALQQAQAAAYFEPGLHGPHVLAAAAHCVEGLWEEALGELDQAQAAAPESPWADALRAFALGRFGNTQGAQTIIGALEDRAHTGEISYVCLAAARCGISQDGPAKQDLDSAFEVRDPQLGALRLSLFGKLDNRELPLS
jgi:TolB-like protein